jgi:hypothetical protein
LHPAPNSADDKTRMANAYSALDPIQESRYYYMKKAPIAVLPPFHSHFCPDCPIAAGPSVGTECPQCGALAWIKDHTGPWEAQIIVQLDAIMGGHVGVLRHDGTVQVVTDRIGSALQASLRSDAVWAPSAEPSPSIGRGLIMPAAVGLSADGTALRERVYQNGPSLLGDGDFVDRPIDVVRTMATTSGGPAPRTKFGTVYSRSTGRVFVVGGADASTGQPTGDVWWRGMDSDAWFRVPLSGYAPETVMASTYSFADGRLWILDEHKQGAVHFARLVRVHPETGEHELLGAWPRPRGWFQSRLFENHWLVVDQDGGVLVVASSMPFRMHAVIRVALDGPAPRVEGIRFAEGHLSSIPVVDVTGYSFVVESKKKNEPPTISRLSDLQLWPGAWSDMGGCL